MRNRQHFTLNLKEDPHDPDTQILMNGEPLAGVRDISVRCGSNGYTNIIVGFNGEAAIKMTGELVANVSLEEIGEQNVANAYDTAMALLGEEPLDFEMKSRFVEHLLSLLITRHIPSVKDEVENGSNQEESSSSEACG